MTDLKSIDGSGQIESDPRMRRVRMISDLLAMTARGEPVNYTHTAQRTEAVRLLCELLFEAVTNEHATTSTVTALDEGNVRSISSAETVQDKRRKMLDLLLATVQHVADGRVIGVLLSNYTGGRQYSIHWAGDYEGVQLAGALEATKMIVVPRMLAPVPGENPVPQKP
jgi:hypothetical protein